MTRAANLAEAAGSGFAFRNRIINGDMRIDQRNAGAEISGNDLWPLDRFNVSSASGVVFKGQRVADAPAGFTNSIKITQSTQGGVTYKLLQHYIEGFNIADFGFGTASAKPFAVSFWVKASITGNYSIVFQNAAGGASRWSYATTYTVSAANTWEFKTIVVPGNTSGTWYTDNQRGLGVLFDIGSTGYETSTTNSWANANALRITGTVDLSANTGATLQLTGVQLEKGSVATPFEFRPYGAELALCQRYYEKSYPIDTVPGTAGIVGYCASTTGSNTVPNTFAYSSTYFKVTKRASPTITIYGFSGATTNVSNNFNGVDLGNNTGALSTYGVCGFQLYNSSGNALATSYYGVIWHYAATAEL